MVTLDVLVTYAYIVIGQCRVAGVIVGWLVEIDVIPFGASQLHSIIYDRSGCTATGVIR